MRGKGGRVIGGVGGGTDPAVAAMLESRARNRSARSKKQCRDSERVRVRLDLPAVLKVALEDAAGRYGTSMSQLGAALVADGLIRLAEPGGEMDEYLGAHLVPSRSLQIECNVELEPLLDILAGLAVGSQGGDS